MRVKTTKPRGARGADGVSNQAQDETQAGTKDNTLATTDHAGDEVTSTNPDGQRLFHGTREEWAERVVASLFPHLFERGMVPAGKARSIRIALAPLPANKLGVCYASEKSANGTVNLISLTTGQADPLDLVHTLCHELLRAFDDCMSGHRGRWKRWAQTLGIEIRGHQRTGETDAMFRSVLAEVGLPVSHVVTVRKAAKPKSSQARYVCPDCGRHVHIPLKSADSGWEITCSPCRAALVRQEAAP